MSIEDRERWEGRHAKAASLKPRSSVLELPRAAKAGLLALDLACGQGRHSLALLDAGYEVVAMDVSRAALQHLRAHEEARSTKALLALQADGDDWPFRDAAFDLVVQTDFLDRRLYPKLRSVLRPRGLLLIDTFLLQDRPNAEGPSRADFLLRAGELPEVFADFEILRYEEQRDDSARALLLARKAAS